MYNIYSIRFSRVDYACTAYMCLCLGVEECCWCYIVCVVVVTQISASQHIFHSFSVARRIPHSHTPHTHSITLLRALRLLFVGIFLPRILCDNNKCLINHMSKRESYRKQSPCSILGSSVQTTSFFPFIPLSCVTFTSMLLLLLLRCRVHFTFYSCFHSVLFSHVVRGIRCCTMNMIVKMEMEFMHKIIMFVRQRQRQRQQKDTSKCTSYFASVVVVVLFLLLFYVLCSLPMFCM